MTNIQNSNRKIIYDVLQGLKQTNADAKLSKRKIYSTLYRNGLKLIDRAANDKKLTKQIDLMKPCCLDLDRVSKIECNIDVPTTCYIYKTIEKLPKIITSSNGPLISGIYTVDSSERIEISTKASAISKVKIKGNTSAVAYIEDEYLYLLNRKYEKIRLVAIYDDKEQACGCNQKTLECFTWLDQQIFIPNFLLNDCVELTIQSLMQTMNIPRDTTNDKTTNV